MYGHGTGCWDPCGYGYGAPVAGPQVAGAYAGPGYGAGAGKGFALIVVLFILLIIVGASYYGKC
ncbi:YjcZ family sporulation protein [Bacillus sp. FJAT-45350]|uniref:YjcZ family sporulation protein n=1 Tax=Bacillus sp. FJAT-45350 TaxID=2011014 RepID=UPI000BB9826F|nr:YjcZ family sporulation protein [Bacillus sp. FJAT-45350]